MMVSNASTRALETIAARQRDVLNAFVPAAMPELGGSPPLTAPEGSYFVTAGDRGRTRYTREAAFTLRDGTLADASGQAVLGYPSPGSPAVPLKADPVDTALGYTSPVHVSGAGEVTYDRPSIDPLTGARGVQRVSIGILALARFPAATNLQAAGANCYSAPRGVVPHMGSANAGGLGVLTPYEPAVANAGIDAGLERLQEAYLAFDALRAAGHAQGSVEKTTMDLLK